MSQSRKAETKTQHLPETKDSFAHVQNRMANGMEGVTSVQRELLQHTDSYANHQLGQESSSACQVREGSVQLGFFLPLLKKATV
jgi:hypothetical protein